MCTDPRGTWLICRPVKVVTDVPVAPDLAAPPRTPGVGFAAAVTLAADVDFAVAVAVAAAVPVGVAVGVTVGVAVGVGVGVGTGAAHTDRMMVS